MKVNEFVKVMGLLKKGTKDTYEIAICNPVGPSMIYRLVIDKEDCMPYYRSNESHFEAIIEDHALKCMETYDCISILNDLDVSSITTENKGTHNHYSIYSPGPRNNDFKVENKIREWSDLNNVKISAALANLDINSLYKLDEATDLTREDNPIIEFISMNNKIIPQEEFDLINKGCKIDWFKYDQDNHKLTVGIQYVYFSPDDNKNATEGVSDTPVYGIPLPLDKQYPEMFKPIQPIYGQFTGTPEDKLDDDDEDDELLCHWDDGCPIEDEEEEDETEPIDVEIHHDENVERKVSMLYIAEVKVADAKYILHIYSPSEDMVESLVFVFVNDIGYTDDDVSDVVVHSCGEILDKKVDNVLFGGEDEAYPADYDIIGIYDDDADKLTVYINNSKDQEEK